MYGLAVLPRYRFFPSTQFNFIRSITKIPIESFNSKSLGFVLNLPNKEKCIFPLYTQETVSDLIIDIREEDRERSVIFLKDSTGIKISPSTLIQDLIKTPFIISIDGKEEYEVTPQAKNSVLGSSDLESLVSNSLFGKVKERLFENKKREYVGLREYFALCGEYGINETQALDYLDSLKTSALVIYFPKNENLKDYIFLKPEQTFLPFSQSIHFKLRPINYDLLKSQIEKLHTLFTPLDNRKQELDRIAANRAKWFMHTGLFYLLIQSGILAHMVWIDFNWGIMEPVTYFVFLSTVIGGFFFFSISGQEYTYNALEQRQIHKVLRKLYTNKAQPFNWKKWNDLNLQINELKSAIGEQPSETPVNESLEKIK